MADRYKINDQHGVYFITMTIVGWIDIFTRKEQKLLLVDSLNYCQANKGLELFGWCLMPSHLHLLCRASEHFEMSDIVRDFKKFTSKAIIKQIEDEPESRKEWLLARFKYNGKYFKRIENYKFWQDGNHAEIIFSNNFFYQKLDYIHKNPVEEMIVTNPEDYYFSSARNYAGMDSLLTVVLETKRLRTY